MEKIKVDDIDKEVNRIKKAVEGAIDNVVAEGFELKYLGTGLNSYISSMVINVIDTRMNKIYKNGNLFLCIGVCCEKYGKGSLYKAYAKEIENTDNFTDEQVEKLRKRL